MENKMHIRIYYKISDGTIVSVVLIGDGDWNLLELNSSAFYTAEIVEFTFLLTDENMEKYLDGPHEVDLEVIREEEINREIDRI